MGENLLNALIVTGIGMGITFAAIVLLWGMMAALTAFAGRPTADTGPAPAPTSEPLAAQAAAVAVAIALAEQEITSARPLTAAPAAMISAWQLSTRSRQLYEKGRRR